MYISNKKTEINREQETATAKDHNAPYDETERMPPIGAWFSEFMSRKGYFRVGNLSLSFLRLTITHK